MCAKSLTWVETEGGPFILLPLELKKVWKGVGDDDDDDDDGDEDDDDEDEARKPAKKAKDDDEEEEEADDDEEEEEEEEEEAENDYERATTFISTVGVLDVGDGHALILGEAEVTAFRATKDGGVFIQRVFGDEDADVNAAVDAALAATAWKATKLVLAIAGKGKLALFDSACAYADADEDEILKLTLAPGSYTVDTARIKTKTVEAGLVRLRRS